MNNPFNALGGNPFDELYGNNQGKRNAGAGDFTSNPFMKLGQGGQGGPNMNQSAPNMAQSMSSPLSNEGTGPLQQGAPSGPLAQEAPGMSGRGNPRGGAAQPPPIPDFFLDMGNKVRGMANNNTQPQGPSGPSPGGGSPAGGPYSSGYWPTPGEMSLLRAGVNPWGGNMNEQQQAWYNEAGPYLGIPELTDSYGGNTQVGRDRTVVNLAEDAGTDMGDAFMHAWLGGNQEQVGRNLYNIRQQRDQSGASDAAHQQWGDRYGWNNNDGGG